MLLLLGVLLSVPAAVLLALVANVVPLERILPSTIRVTGPVEADWRALFWIGFFLLLGLATGAQGAHRVRRGTGSARLLVATLALGTLLLAAGLFARALR